MEIAAALQDVSFSYGSHTVLNEVALDLVLGEVKVITGSNGSGKSTLARIVAGLLPVDHGKRIGDRACSFVAADIAPPKIRASTWIEGLGGDSHEVDKALAIMNFRGQPNSMCPALSFGNWRKLVFACALSQPNRLLVVDELIAGMDEAGLLGAAQLLADKASQGRAILIVDQFSAVTHLRAFAVSSLQHGQLVAA